MPDKYPPTISFTLSLKEAKCLSFKLSDFAKKNEIPIPSNGYQFEFNVQSQLNENNKAIIINFVTKLYEKNDNKNELAELKALVILRILNYDEIVIKNENGAKVPDQLISTCSGIALSTIRGMYIIKLESTPYSNALIPLMDTNVFIPKKPEQIA